MNYLKIAALWSFLLVHTLSCQRRYPGIFENAVQYQINDSIPEDKKMLALIAPYTAKLKETMSSGLAPLSGELTLGKPESTLGNWITDILHRYITETKGINCDFTLSNYGGIRSNYIKQDSLRVGIIFELLPFDNELVVLSLKGSEVEALVRYMSKSGFWPVSKGLQILQTDNRIERISIQGNPLVPEQIYKVQMPDYVANGGDGTAFLAIAPREKSGMFMREAVIEQLRIETKKGMIQQGMLDERILIRNNEYEKKKFH
jgi:2',3'-cyclic-nucleotide 2'-phosphodiesterase (5'-nucleotidase family)